MLKKILITIFICSMFTTNVFSAPSGGDSSTKTKSSYDKAVNFIKKAQKFEKKGKLEKANKQYEKARKLLIKSNNKIPNKPDTLNYLGFTTRKLGDFEGGEKYYLEGLAIDPKHIGINEYLGELYVATGRIDLAKERLQVLSNCNCEEYQELELIIKTKGTNTATRTTVVAIIANETCLAPL